MLQGYLDGSIPDYQVSALLMARVFSPGALIMRQSIDHDLLYLLRSLKQFLAMPSGVTNIGLIGLCVGIPK